MKKFIGTVIIGILVILVLDMTIGKTLRYFYFKQDSGIYYRTTFSMQETKADILVFGTSRAYHHYDTRLLEDSLHMTAYNTGRDGEFIFYQTAVLKSVLKRYTPKLIILDFTGSFEYSQADYDRLSALLPYYKNHPEIRDIVALKSPFERYKLSSHIYPHNSSLLTIIAGNMDFNKNRVSNRDYHGYVPLDGMHTKQLDTLHTPINYPLDNNKLSVFTEFITLTKSKNIPVYVVNSPSYYLYKTDFSLDTARKICAKNGVPFIDFSRDAEFLSHSDYFADETHLNKKGAESFTKKVIRLLKNDEQFTEYLKNTEKQTLLQ